MLSEMVTRAVTASSFYRSQAQEVTEEKVRLVIEGEE